LAITWLTNFEQLGEAARTLLRRALQIAEASYDHDHPDVADIGDRLPG
jgi:hypothetical protein